MHQAEIILNEKVAHSIYLLRLRANKVAESANPGQFLHVKCTKGPHPLLRRPFSIADVQRKKDTADIIYRVVGEGTSILSQKKPGEVLDLMGPLGRGFPLPLPGTLPLIVGGGVGVAPLLFLAKKLSKVAGLEGRAFLGFSSARETFGMEVFESYGFSVELATVDGTCGKMGFPTELLEDYLKSEKKVKAIVYACGPRMLLLKVKEIAASCGIPAYLSLEERMGCGIGACLGCAVKSAKGGYKKVCRDGPVFEAGEVEIW
ncbi:Dihydroorotate dehydrogenase B (NAD(+)), electron transfer subunit [Fervidicola ferrireducens]|uniref:Dihydroorotate dehydrogenase B (NAD(+)), electron transfer subunit n=1 Tax=Fervidicola ferrireducens TaxID=520764 RepID=A0A140L4D8_9FIRM|nr:dihydroorotate dehydrogenase electron transfer subunit [Fervidicola ferrireducens]KXG75413.1 Dihydroorotate dehydrogenase B (NAD(+)), electron transfer subunit [Fervidicola ferrireducens]